mmetsp:Transcript_13710/g.27033  ORF Transcript_13710/g.27033 Transcript_13710/m.27033 type:complete len:200 (-) Transcript_13710:1848-2447(-)
MRSSFARNSACSSLSSAESPAKAIAAATLPPLPSVPIAFWSSAMRCSLLTRLVLNSSSSCAASPAAAAACSSSSSSSLSFSSSARRSFAASPAALLSVACWCPFAACSSAICLSFTSRSALNSSNSAVMSDLGEPLMVGDADPRSSISASLAWSSETRRSRIANSPSSCAMRASPPPGLPGSPPVAGGPVSSSSDWPSS